MGSITHRDSQTHESVFRDLISTIPNKAHRVRTLWALFDDESLLGSMILKRLDVEIKQITNEARISTHAHALMEGEIIDVDLLWIE